MPTRRGLSSARPQACCLSQSAFARRVLRPNVSKECEMKQIFVSNYGDDNNHGLGRSAPVKSRKRLYELCRGDTEMVLIEGSAIFERLMTEALELDLTPRAKHGRRQAHKTQKGICLLAADKRRVTQSAWLIPPAAFRRHGGRANPRRLQGARCQRSGPRLRLWPLSPSRRRHGTCAHDGRSAAHRGEHREAPNRAPG
jgi:hypothetical protein